jgi:hypothetical protein
LGEGSPTADKQFASIPDASTRFLFGELEADNAAAAIAILADRRGANPDEALLPIHERRALFHRCHVYQIIWNAYGSEAERAARPRAPRPSKALALAAIKACEASIPKTSQIHPSTLAAAYARLDDREGVIRAMARDPRSPPLVRLETALYLRDLGNAAEVASTPIASINRDERPRFANLRAQIIREAAENGRADLVLRLANRVLEDMDPVDRSYPDEILPSVEALLRLDREAARRFVSTLDARARDIESLTSFGAAAGAVRGWTALGEIDRARALIDLWIPRVEPRGVGCGGDLPFCAFAGVADMLAEIGKPEEAWATTPSGGPYVRLSADFDRGRGVKYLDIHLAHARTPREHDEALRHCVGRANYERQQLAWADHCARRLLTRVRTLPTDSDSEFRRQLAILASLELASLAARHGDRTLAQEMLSTALGLTAEVANLPLGPSERQHLLDLAIFQLEGAGRL